MDADNTQHGRIKKEILNKTFLTKLTGTMNGVIPNQLHRKELVKILENAAKTHNFLNAVDADGKKMTDKIISIFDFRVPYYVGPLNRQAPNSWVIRTGEKIYPWNFDKIVDTEKSAEKFIINLIGKCSYTAKDVIPRDSLLYSAYSVLNEINPIKINGRDLPVSVKQELYTDLFLNSTKSVTKKSIKAYLLSKGYISKEEEISGIDDTVKSKLKSYHDFSKILSKTKNTEMVEKIIKSILIFGDDKKMLRTWIRKNTKHLNEDDIAYICRLKYKKWGRLSKEFLTEVYSTDENGEAHSIIEMLQSTNNTLMQLLSSDYQFSANAEAMRNSVLGGDCTVRDMIDEMPISPSVRRSIWQTLKIIDEIVDIRKSAPSKIFIEVARGNKNKMKQRTVSRKNKLIALYKSCDKESSELFEELKNEPEENLRRDQLYLYYTQFGKCMYSGRPIDINALTDGNKSYDIDHIYPQSRIKDDSIDNRVLVKSQRNRDKSNIYPIDENTRTRMYPFWKMLCEKGLISEKKYTRLVRATTLTDKELSDFVARQLVETQQSTKALANIIKYLYPREMRVVYSKAANVSDFRQHYEFVKCRDVNDLHHAKDAYLNIVVGNVYNTKFTDRFFANIQSENYSLKRVFDYDTPGAWQVDRTIATVRNYMAKNNILVTRMPHEGRGQLFDLQIVPAGKGQLPVKAGMDINKYGGYNKLAGAYFFVVAHTENGKRLRTIETVYIYQKSLYESDSIAYCTKILGLADPVIIVPMIRIDALLELDGKRVCVCGRTGSRLLLKHSYQLTIDTKHEQYIKAIAKYVDRCTKAKKELQITKEEKISRAFNLDLYDLFIEKFKAGVYASLLKNVCSEVVENRSLFEKMSVAQQCALLIEILKSFRCDRQVSNLEKICGKKSVGALLTSKQISAKSSAYLINQSVTGLYETKIDLLK